MEQGRREAMLTLLFVILMLAVFGKLRVFSLKASWGIAKILLTVVFLPVLLVGMAFAGLMVVALPAVLIVGAVMLLKAVV